MAHVLWFAAGPLGSRLRAPSENWIWRLCWYAGAWGWQDGPQPGPDAPPHSPGRTSQGYWRAESCPEAAEGNPHLTGLEKTTRVCIGMGMGVKGAQSTQTRWPRPAPSPFLSSTAPGAGRGISSQSPQKGSLLCHDTPLDPSSHQPHSGLNCWQGRRSRDSGRGSGKH